MKDPVSMAMMDGKSPMRESMGENFTCTRPDSDVGISRQKPSYAHVRRYRIITPCVSVNCGLDSSLSGVPRELPYLMKAGITKHG